MAPKRNRVSLLCTFCKKRKIKCDRQQPCSTCIKRGKEECVYHDEPIKEEDDKTMILNELKILRNKVRKLEDKLDDSVEGYPNASSIHGGCATPEDLLTLSAIDDNVSNRNKLVPSAVIVNGDLSSDFIGYNPVYSEKDVFEALSVGVASTSTWRTKCSAFSLFALTVLDSSLLCHVKYIVHVRQQKTKTSKEQADTYAFDGEKPILPEHLRDVEKEYVEMLLNDKGDFIAYNSKDAKRAMALRQRFGVAYNFINLVDDVEGFSKEVLSCLPTSNIVWKLIDIFLTRFNVLYPILSKEELYDNASRIIGPRSLENKKITALKIEKRMDFATLGILLLVLRFGYLSCMAFGTNLQSGNNFRSPSDTKDLKDVEIGTEFVTLAKKCSYHFDIIKVATLEVFKLTLLLKLYSNYAPEEGDRGPEQEAVLFSTLVYEMACGLGLDSKEVCAFKEKEMIDKDSQFKIANSPHAHLWWITHDEILLNSLNFGTHFPIDIEVFDVEIPNTWSPLGDDVMIKIDGPLIPRSLMSDVVKLLGLTKSYPKAKLPEITRILDGLESKIFNNPRFPLDCFFNLELSELARVKNMKFFLKISHSCICIWFIIYIGYVKAKNSKYATFYMNKLLSILLFKVIPTLLKSANECQTYFPDIGDFTLVPDYITLLVKFAYLLIGLLTRFVLAVKGDKSENRRSMAANIVSLSKQICMKCFKEAVRYGPKYFAAWQAAVELKLFLDGIELEKCFKFINDGEADFFEDIHIFEIENTLRRGSEYFSKQLNEADNQAKSNNNLGFDLPAFDNTMFDTFLNTMNMGDFHFEDSYMDGLFKNFMDE